MLHMFSATLSGSKLYGFLSYRRHWLGSGGCNETQRGPVTAGRREFGGANIISPVPEANP